MNANRVRDYLVAEGVGAMLVQLVGLTVVAALAVSRAADNLLSPGALAMLLTAVAVVAGLVGRPIGVYEGAHHVLEDKVGPPPLLQDAGRDPLDARSLRGSALRWALGLGAWAGAAGLLVAAALQGRRAPFVVTAVALVIVGGGASVVAALVGRADGLAAAGLRGRAITPAVPLRRRAWRQIGVPMALVQAGVNAGFAVLLFHDARPLTESVARADALLVVLILTLLFGYLATRWGRVDAALGRVSVDDDVAAGVTEKQPLGRQGLVYVAFAGLLAFGFAGMLLPPLPSLVRVALVRGAVAGLLTLVVCGVAHVRGALNALAGASPFGPVAPSPRPRRDLQLPSVGTVGQVLFVVVLTGLLVRPTVAAPRAVAAEPPHKQLAAEGEAFVARIEYDVPLPAGTGTVASVVGRVGPPSGDNAYGLAASPSALDAVVSGKWYNALTDEDPTQPGDQPKGPVPIPEENHFPQVECFHPGNDTDLRFTFPTDARDDTKSAPPIGYATAHCASGPTSEVHSRVAEFGAQGLLTTGPAGGDGLFRPVKGVLEGTATAWANDVSLLGGAIHIDSVALNGSSAVNGQPGGQHTLADVRLQGVNVGGTTFSVDGDHLVVAGQSQPLDRSGAQQVLAAANAALTPLGCSMSVVGPTTRYPEGFVLARKPPDVGVNPDGSRAASMAGGLLVLCDLPEDMTEKTGFSPQRVQILVGFVYTSAAANDVVGGFSLGDVASLTGPIGGGLSSLGGEPSRGPLVTPEASPVEASPAAPATPAAPRARARAVPLPAAFVAVAGVFGKWPVWVAALLVWAAITERGVRRLRRVFQEVGAA